MYPSNGTIRCLIKTVDKNNAINFTKTTTRTTNTTTRTSAYLEKYDRSMIVPSLLNKKVRKITPVCIEFSIVLLGYFPEFYVNMPLKNDHLFF